MTDGPVPHEPELSGEVAARRKGLRTGYTTGTCAAGAAKAAAEGLVGGTVPDRVEVGLPGGQRVVFPVEGAGPVATGRPPTAVVVKDAGDDPDCTHGARMTAEVTWRGTDEEAPGHRGGGEHAGGDRGDGGSEGEGEGDAEGVGGGEGGTELLAGPGIGTVTLPGLGIPVGAPAITAVPRRMILAALAEVAGLDGRPVRVRFSVPGGEQMAAKTSNARLGIVGGISILGTTGIVRPFSTAAYRASVVQQVDVAAAQGAGSMVLCTGSRSEQAAFALFPRVAPVQVVEVGDFTGTALRHCAAKGMTEVTIVAMAGKIAKLAAGVMMTHFHRSKVDTDLLAEVARQADAPAEVVVAAGETATARHFYDACRAAGTAAPLELLCRRAAAACRAHTAAALAVSVVMVDFEGREVVARG